MAEKIAIPEDQAELEELMSDQGKVGQLAANGQWPAVIKAYATVTDDRVTIAEQVKEKVMGASAAKERRRTGRWKRGKSTSGAPWTDRRIPGWAKRQDNSPVCIPSK